MPNPLNESIIRLWTRPWYSSSERVSTSELFMAWNPADAAPTPATIRAASQYDGAIARAISITPNRNPDTAWIRHAARPEPRPAM